MLPISGFGWSERSQFAMKHVPIVARPVRPAPSRPSPAGIPFGRRETIELKRKKALHRVLRRTSSTQDQHPTKVIGEASASPPRVSPITAGIRIDRCLLKDFLQASRSILRHGSAAGLPIALWRRMGRGRFQEK